MIDGRALNDIMQYKMKTGIDPQYLYVGTYEYNEIRDLNDYWHRNPTKENEREQFVGLELVIVERRSHFNIC